MKQHRTILFSPHFSSLKENPEELIGPVYVEVGQYQNSGYFDSNGSLNYLCIWELEQFLIIFTIFHYKLTDGDRLHFMSSKFFFTALLRREKNKFSFL